MRRSPLVRIPAAFLMGFGPGLALPAWGQDAPTTMPAPELVRPPSFAPMSLKPLPQPIPDDPPPHEGALYDLPLTIHPTDIIVVEALEGLPGRRITGEHLVRSDGKISLGFYGEVHVRGLTISQAKTKIILHLRQYLTDAILGLLLFESSTGPEFEMPTDIGPEVPGPADAPQPSTPTPGTRPDLGPKPEAKPHPVAKPSGESRATAHRHSRSTATLARFRAAPSPRRQEPQPPVLPGVPPGSPNDDVAEAFRLKPFLIPNEPGAKYRIVDPADSDRVFVEFTSFNSRVYFVQGDVGTPGRLPFTGQETVLDALNFAGGFTASAEPTDFHLHRPARGGAPARDYRIDHGAILRGDVTANLQVFPGDRLVVGRKPVVARTVQLDQALAPFNSILNAAFQTAITARTIGLAGGDINGTDQAARDATIRRFFDLLKTPSDGRPDRIDTRRLLDGPPLPVQPRPDAIPGNPPTPPAGPEPR